MGEKEGKGGKKECPLSARWDLRRNREKRGQLLLSCASELGPASPFMKTLTQGFRFC